MKQFYKACNFIGRSRQLIDIINGIVDEYSAQHLRLTVRQIYYQLVSRDHIENTLQSYKRTASLINDGRLAGLIDWNAIEDRTRAFKGRYHATSPQDSLENLAAGYHLDMWENQESRVYLVIEKEALVGVFSDVCYTYDVPLLAARGYPSASVIREFSEYNIKGALEEGQRRGYHPPGRPRPFRHRHDARS